MKEIVANVVQGENEESGSTVQKAGADITSALTAKASAVKREKETTTTKEITTTTERWGTQGGTVINTLQISVDISKIKDLPLLYKLIDELKDVANRTSVPVTVTA